MATCGSFNAEFRSICNNAFYFDDTGESIDVDEDSFRMSRQCSQHLIQSKDNKFLLFNEKGQFRACDRSISQQSECKFTVQMYQDSALEQKKGRAVILYIRKKDNTILVCCNEKNEICPVKMELPQEINESQHKAVFYLTKLSASNVCTFESSLCRGQFLGFEHDEDNPSLKKLALCPRYPDEVDDTSEIIMN
uniref:Interleukin-18 n=1 Tax=Anabas testudineus TaxID=64144 RepID=A0AAQ6IAS2_ANATE